MRANKFYISIRNFIHTTVSEKNLYVAESDIQGKGIRTNKPYQKGVFISFISGVEKKHTATNAKEAGVIPNWYGLTRDLWIDPGEGIFRYLNHSCDPNTAIVGRKKLIARKKIKAGEEITIDYSMTDADEYWELDYICNCGAKTCRKHIRSIQSLSPSVIRRHMPLIPKYFLNVYKKAHPSAKI